MHVSVRCWLWSEGRNRLDSECRLGSIGVAVVNGTVSLSGEVDAYAERLAAKRAVQYLRGVYSVDNRITLNNPSPCG